jgi:hypothetical protein
VGDISAPQRNDWCVEASIKFIQSLPARADYKAPRA